MYQQVFELHAELLKALSHPKRLEIIQLLRLRKLTVTDIQLMLDLPQANLSQHLQILRKAGVVKTEKKGKNIIYQISHRNFIKASDLLRQVLIDKYQGKSVPDELTMKMADLLPLATDPICGMRLSPKTAAFAYKHNDSTYYFCASGCLQKFKNDSKILNNVAKVT